ncbi:MAG: hypothetical protein WCI89_02310 [bacterium]
MKKIALIASSLFALPFVAFAAPLENIIALIQQIAVIINYLIPILVGLALVYFFWGLVSYIRHPDIKAGKDTMIAGIISLFIMISIWGIVIFAQQALGINATPTPLSAPHFQ